MKSSNWLGALGLCGVLLVVSGLVNWLPAADDSDSEVEVKLEEGGKDFTNSVGMKLVRIPKAKFMMGSPNDEPNAQQHEKPRHQVELTKDFYLAVHEVTQKQYQTLMGNNPSYFSKNGGGSGLVNNVDTDDFPVDTVSWNDAQEFVKKLNAKAEEKGRRRVYRLPTEAEWEYACRAGTDVKEPFTLKKPVDTLDPKQVNYRAANLNRTSKVGSYDPNPFGLFDMHGNLLEWCHDWFGETTYGEKDRKDPTGPQNGSYRILRSGAWVYDPLYCRSASRLYTSVDQRASHFGFRVACDARRD